MADSERTAITVYGTVNGYNVTMETSFEGPPPAGGFLQGAVTYAQQEGMVVGDTALSVPNEAVLPQANLISPEAPTTAPPAIVAPAPPQDAPAAPIAVAAAPVAIVAAPVGQAVAQTLANSVGETVCPIHGPSKLRAGKGGVGSECGAFEEAAVRPVGAWAALEPWRGKEGTASRFYCTWNNQPPKAA